MISFPITLLITAIALEMRVQVNGFGNYDTKLRTSDPSQVDENVDTMSFRRSLTDETSSEGLFKSKGYVKQTNTGKEKLMSLP